MEPRGDVFIVEPLFAQRHDGPEFVERVEINTRDVFSERILDLEGVGFADDAGDGNRLG